MKLTKEWKLVLGIALVAAVGYVAWRWYQARVAAGESGIPQLGTNLNSVAPELVGGSSGPSAGPAVAMPLHITLTEQVTEPESSKNEGVGQIQRTVDPLKRINNASANPGVTLSNGSEPLIKQSPYGVQVY